MNANEPLQQCTCIIDRHYMQFDDPQQHVVTFECAPSDTNSVVHLLSADGCCGNCGAFCYRPQEIAGSVCPRVCVTLDSPQLCSLYLCVCAPRICVFVLPVFLAQVHVCTCVYTITMQLSVYPRVCISLPFPGFSSTVYIFAFVLFAYCTCHSVLCIAGMVLQLLVPSCCFLFDFYTWFPESQPCNQTCILHRYGQFALVQLINMVSAPIMMLAMMVKMLMMMTMTMMVMLLTVSLCLPSSR